MMNKKHSCFLDANRRGTLVRVFRGKKPTGYKKGMNAVVSYIQLQG